MLAPFPDRLRSSRPASAQDNATSTSTPPPPASHPLPPTTSTPHHGLFPTRSSLRMRTNSLSSPSTPPLHSDSTDHVPHRTLRTSSRRPLLHSRPSTSTGVPDSKHPPVVPILITSPFPGASPIPPFADFMPMRRRSTKKPHPPRKENAVPTHSNRTDGATLVDPAKRDARLSTPDRAILKELKLGAAARESQFKIKGSKKHHAYPTNEAPYPCNYERPVIDHDVWETGFVRQLSGSQTFHVFGTPPTKVLDLGCGTGYWILECAKLWRNCEFVGLDLVPLHPDLSHLRSPELGSRITWVQANCLEGLPFPNEEFDFVHIKRIAHGIPEDKWDFMLEEISRVMKPGAAIEMIEEDLFFPGRSPDSDSPVSWSPTPIPQCAMPPNSTHHLINGQYHNANDQRSISQFGPTSILSANAPIYIPSLPSNSGLLHSDSSRQASGAPLNPRDHSLLEYIYTEMHAARFINLSPLSLLASSLPVYFNSVRSHAPIMFMFPPTDLTGVRQKLLPTDERGALESKTRLAQHCHKDSVKTTSAMMISRRQILNHMQQYVVLDESAVAPGTITARQKASSTSSLHHPSTACNAVTPTQSDFPSISVRVSPESSLLREGYPESTAPTQAGAHGIDTANWLNTLPNQRLQFDLQSLNLHLSARVTEILACTEAMWEWICEYQDSQRSHRKQPHVHKEHPQLRNTHPGERGGAHKFSAELVGLSRAEFDVLLTRFELDMRDCINIGSRITSVFHAPAPSLAPTNERKAFNSACEKWEEYQIKERERHGAHPTAVAPKGGTDPATSTGQRLSRTIRVFCAWKAS